MTDNSKKIILHLCAKEGSDSIPYRDAGYDVRIIGEEIGVENFIPPPQCVRDHCQSTLHAFFDSEDKSKNTERSKRGYAIG